MVRRPPRSPLFPYRALCRALVARLTGGRVHATDPTNASRTLLYDLRAGGWSDELCELLRVPPAALPEVRPSSGDFGRTDPRSEEHTSELQPRQYLVCRLLLE